MCHSLHCRILPKWLTTWHMKDTACSMTDWVTWHKGICLQYLLLTKKVSSRFRYLQIPRTACAWVHGINYLIYIYHWLSSKCSSSLQCMPAFAELHVLWYGMHADANTLHYYINHGLINAVDQVWILCVAFMSELNEAWPQHNRDIMLHAHCTSLTDWGGRLSLHMCILYAKV